MSGLPQPLGVATLLRVKFPHVYHSQPTCLETHQTEGIDTLEVTFRQTNKNKKSYNRGKCLSFVVSLFYILADYDVIVC